MAAGYLPSLSSASVAMAKGINTMLLRHTAKWPVYADSRWPDYDDS